MHVHFVGIGGYGMSAVAFVLHGEGVTVTGSDVQPSSRTRRLEEAGVRIVYGHAEENQRGADQVVYSTDVPQDNVELRAARARGARVVHRSEMLAEILLRGRGVCVTGTHGKTTTTSLIAAILVEAGLDPSAVIGGELEWLSGNARIGRGGFVVAEADESDGSFLRYHPEIAVLTNVEPEHLDHYDGDFGKVLQAYRQFLQGVSGLVLTCHDEPLLGQLASGITCEHRTYGLSRGSDYRGLRLRPLRTGGHRFTVESPEGVLGRCELPIPGVHNVRNALAAIAVGHRIGVPFSRMAETLARFRNAARRFEVVGRGRGITVVSDYAHHPTEIAAVIAAARELRPRRLLAVFQPQRYARTKLFLHEFPKALSGADQVLLLDIYAPPGEEPIAGVSSSAIAREVESCGARATHLPRLEEAYAWLTKEMRDGDIVLVMGAGDIYRLAQDLGRDLQASVREAAPPAFGCVRAQSPVGAAGEQSRPS